MKVNIFGSTYEAGQKRPMGFHIWSLSSVGMLQTEYKHHVFFVPIIYTTILARGLRREYPRYQQISYQSHWIASRINSSITCLVSWVVS